MGGIAAVEARIAEIQGRIASLSSPTGGATSSGATFAATLTAAVSATPAAAGAGAALTAAGTTPGTTLSLEDGLAGLRLRQGAVGSASMTADGAPSALAAYGNGEIPATALSPIGRGDHRLWGPAAEGFQRMSAAAARDGVDIGVTDSYRSYDAQVEVAARKGLYSQGGLAAEPGTSDHGWGRALDLDLDSQAQAWMRKNAGEFGFVEDTPREPWHWAYSPPR